MDYEKLAEMGNFKNANSASATYLAAKKKLLALGGASASTDNPTPKATPKKSKASGEHSANDAEELTENPTTPTPTAKKTKARIPKSTIKAEDTTDTKAAGDADNEDSTVTPTKKRARAPAKSKLDENGNVIPPKKRTSAAQKAAKKAADEAAEAEAQQKQKHTDDLVTRLLTAQANGLEHVAYEQAVGDDEILQEDGHDASVAGEETGNGDGDHKMTQDEEDEKLFDTSMYDKKADPVDDDAADLMDAEEA